MHTHLGFIGTTLLGIGGSVVGGLIARLWSKPPEGSRFHPAGLLMSIQILAIEKPKKWSIAAIHYRGAKDQR
jgi:uncharacterized membrane protein YeaQ/YmgE (transglycosylase-associated protein family)